MTESKINFSVDMIPTRDDICEECGGRIINHHGERKCIGCGIVMDSQAVCLSPRDYDIYSRSRLLHNDIVGPFASTRTILPSGSTTLKKCRVERPSHWRRLGKENVWFAGNNRFAYHKNDFEMITSLLELPSHVKLTAFQLLTECSKRNYLRGKVLPAMIKACIFYACMIQKHPIFIKKIINDANLESAKSLRRQGKEINVCLRYVHKIAAEKFDVNKISLEMIINLIGNNLDIRIDEIMLALKLHSIMSWKADDIRYINAGGKNLKNIFGDNKPTLAASLIYISTRFHDNLIKQGEICSVAGISEVTLRSRVSDIIEAFQELFMIRPVVGRKDFNYKLIGEVINGEGPAFDMVAETQRQLPSMI